MSHLLSFLIITLESDLTIVPSFLTVTMLQIVYPFTLVNASSCIHENTLTICHIACPVALIYITICLSHASNTAHYVINKHAFILGSITPDQCTNTIFDKFSINIAFKLSFVFLSFSNVLGILDVTSLCWFCHKCINLLLRNHWLISVPVNRRLANISDFFKLSLEQLCLALL